MQKYNIVAMIPARKGSERLKLKNLALLKGHPLISYANAEKKLKRQRKIYEEMKRALAKKDKEILEREENNFLTKTTNFILDLLIDHFKKIILIIIAIIILLLILDKFSLLPWTTL